MSNLNHELRSKGIGSSEIAMLVLDENGQPLSPWGGPHKLWRIKTGQEEKDDDEKPWLDRGNALEPWILQRYANKMSARLRRSPGARQHSKFPYVVDSVDALAWLPGDEKVPGACVEAKAPLLYSLSKWGEEGTDDVPKEYLVQGQWHMGAWGIQRCDYPIDAGGDIKIFTSTHDEELWMSLVMIAEKFWKDHVEANKAPAVDHTKETSRWLSRHLDQKSEDLVSADKELEEKLRMYCHLRGVHDSREKELELLANEIKEAIGDHKGVHLPEDPKARITFSFVNGRAKFDHAKYIEELIKMLPEGTTAPDRLLFTEQGVPYRQFRPQGLLKRGANL